MNYDANPSQAHIRDLKVEMTLVSTLKPAERNARTHSKKQIRRIADSIERFGFTNPVLIDAGSRIIAGHGRVEAASLAGALVAIDRECISFGEFRIALRSIVRVRIAGRRGRMARHVARSSPRRPRRRTVRSRP